MRYMQILRPAPRDPRRRSSRARNHLIFILWCMCCGVLLFSRVAKGDAWRGCPPSPPRARDTWLGGGRAGRLQARARFLGGQIRAIAGSWTIGCVLESTSRCICSNVSPRCTLSWVRSRPQPRLTNWIFKARAGTLQPTRPIHASLPPPQREAHLQPVHIKTDAPQSETR